MTADYTGSGGSDLGLDFAVTVEDSTSSGITNSVVKINQIAIGIAGSTTPGFEQWVVTPDSNGGLTGPGTVPRHTRFRKGSSADVKSAGDKAMDLWGVLNNSNNSNPTGIKGSGGGAIGALLGATGFLLPALALSFGFFPEKAKDLNIRGREDYIIGIQIPYQSLITSSSIPGEYTPRNFFMPTGGDYDPEDKGSTKNLKDVGVDFDPWTSDGDLTGIKGTVGKMDITYHAAETVYELNMVFMPADWIL